MINEHHTHDDQEPWVESAIFWIEGVATPGVSLGGLLGEDLLFVIRVFDDYHLLMITMSYLGSYEYVMGNVSINDFKSTSESEIIS